MLLCMEELNKCLMLMALLVFSHEMFAQDASHNYILHEVMLNALGTSQNTTVSYLDGIGRPSREVTNSLGTSGSYVSTMTLYDACGRPSCTYFPTAIGSSPSFLSESGLCASSRSFYGDNFAYTSKNYDVLQREMTIFGGGDLWQNNSRDVSKEYGVNNESVKRYISTVSNGRLLENGEYAPGTLHTEITKDEDGKLFTIYKIGWGKRFWNAVLLMSILILSMMIWATYVLSCLLTIKMMKTWRLPPMNIVMTEGDVVCGNDCLEHNICSIGMMTTIG